MTTTKISKAEQLRIKQATEYINANLRRKLENFENNYLNKAMEWAFKKLNSDIEQHQNRLEKLDSSKRSDIVKKQDIDYSISLLKKRLKNDAILRLNSLNEAKKGYDEKVNKVVNVLVKEGFSHLHFRIEEISNAGSELAFLISNDKKEVHARVIFASGPIQAPHFRFITTVRQK